MKKSLLVATLAVVSLQQPSHALFGLGVTYGRNFTTIDGANQSLAPAEVPLYLQQYAGDNAPSLTLSRASVSGLTQVGVKTWLDLPLIPVEFEGSANLGFGEYASEILLDDGDTVYHVPTSVDLPMNLAGTSSGKTPYSSLALDVSVRYAFLSLPPLSPLKPLKFYAGAGVSWFYATRVIDKADVAELFAGTPTGPVTDKVLKDKLKDNLYKSKIGGHLLLGTQFKVPVLPLAIFVDGKWYINSATSDAATNNPFAVSAGAAFAL